MDKAIALIMQFEGCKLTAYPDPASELAKALANGVSGVALTGLRGAPWTIGYGTTQGVIRGLKWTQEQADKALLAHATEVAASILHVTPSLSENRLDALISLVYNIGIGNYTSSTLAKCILAKDWNGAANQILVWNKANGQIMAGLVRRREAERSLFVL
jgi:lysozyme